MIPTESSSMSAPSIESDSATERAQESSNVGGDTTTPLPGQAPDGQPTDAATHTSTDLATRVTSGTVVMTAGYVLGQVLRLGSNLILTRLLTPDLFGLMAIVHSFLAGYQMFSDMGIGPGIIHSKSGNKKAYLNTAWTIQVIRGVGITVIAFITAPLIGTFYDSPDLTALLAVSAVSAVINGFASTAVFTAHRDLTLGRLTILQLGSQAVGAATAVGWALADPSVWALVSGHLASALVVAAGSHLFLVAHRHRFVWDQDSAHELVHFGKWIFLSTVFGFFVNHADRLIIGKLFTMADLGAYSIALVLANFVKQLLARFRRSVQFPIYSATRRDHPEQLPALVRRSKIKLCAFVIPPLALIVAGGDFAVQIMYDARYEDAGWMLRMIALALLIETCLEAGPVLLANGDSRLLTKAVGAQSVIQLACMIYGGVHWGPSGLIWGLVVSRLISYPVSAYCFRKYQSWFPGLDAATLAIAAVLCLVALQLRAAVVSSGLLG